MVVRRWLLDTCVLSETFRPQADAGVVRWLTQNGNQAAVSAVTWGELQEGLERIAPSRHRNALQAWFEAMHLRYAPHSLPSDAAVWAHWARIKASLEVMGRRQEDLDILIAATASAHGLTLVTRNTRHFIDTGVPLINPWGGADAASTE